MPRKPRPPCSVPGCPELIARAACRRTTFATTRPRGFRRLLWLL